MFLSRCLTKQMNAVIEIKFPRLVCVELYRDNKILGRFMLRYSGKTIAAGVVTEVSEWTHPLRLNYLHSITMCVKFPYIIYKCFISHEKRNFRRCLCHLCYPFQRHPNPPDVMNMLRSFHSGS